MKRRPVDNVQRRNAGGKQRRLYPCSDVLYAAMIGWQSGHTAFSCVPFFDMQLLLAHVLEKVTALEPAISTAAVVSSHDSSTPG